MKVKSCYFLTWSDDKSKIIAAAPDGTKPSHELIEDVSGVDTLPFDLVIKTISESKEGIRYKNIDEEQQPALVDYLPNTLVWPLMSSELRNLFEKVLSGNEGINWITAKVILLKSSETYYIPCFTKKLDVLNEEKTVFVKSTKHIIKPYFDLNKVRTLSLFHKPTDYGFWKIPSGLYVTDTTKNALLNSKLTGFTFENVSCS
jgi:hypothetical protein